MKDSIIRALGYDGQLRVSAVVTTELCEELRKRHDTFPVAAERPDRPTCHPARRSGIRTSDPRWLSTP